MTTIPEIIEGLTNPEKDAILSALFLALVRNDARPDARVLQRDLTELAYMLDHAGCRDREIAIEIPDDALTLPRSNLTAQMVLDIRSAPSAKEAADRLGIPASTARGIRRRASWAQLEMVA